MGPAADFLSPARHTRRFRAGGPSKWWNFFLKQSLLIFIGLTGIAWAALFFRMNPESKWARW
jgi:hypothetical protein